MNWRTGDVVRQAVRNLRTSMVRTVLLAGACAALLAAVGLSEMFTTARFVADELTNRDQGSYVAVAESDAGLLASDTCESVGRSALPTGGGGGVMQTQIIELSRAPGIPFRLLVVSPGLSHAMRMAGDVHGVGESAARELGLADGQPLEIAGTSRPVQVLPEESLTVGLSRALVVTGVPNRPVGSCLASFDGSTFDAGTEMLRTAFRDVDGLEVRRLGIMPSGRSPREAHDVRSTRLLWLAAAGVLLLVLSVVAWTRRAEAGLYLAAGSAPSEWALLLAAETSMAVGAGALAGAALVAGAGLLSSSVGYETVRAGLWHVAMATGAVLAGIPLIGLMGGQSDISVLLRDR